MFRLALVAVALFALGADAAFAARSAEQTARASARKRGYTAAQTTCFVPLFVSYAYPSRTGAWIAGPRGRRGDAYRHEAWSRCGVVR